MSSHCQMHRLFFSIWKGRSDISKIFQVGIFNEPDGIFNFEFEPGSSFLVKFIVFFSFIFIILRIEWSRFYWQEIWETKNTYDFSAKTYGLKIFRVVNPTLTDRTKWILSPKLVLIFGIWTSIRVSSCFCSSSDFGDENPRFGEPAGDRLGPSSLSESIFGRGASKMKGKISSGLVLGRVWDKLGIDLG